MKKERTYTSSVHASVDPWLDSVRTESSEETDLIISYESARKEVKRVVEQKKADERTEPSVAREEVVVHVESSKLEGERCTASDERVEEKGTPEEQPVRLEDGSEEEKENVSVEACAHVSPEERAEDVSEEETERAADDVSVEEEEEVSYERMYEDVRARGVQTMRRFESLYVGLDVAFESLTAETSEATNGIAEQLEKVREVLLMQWQVVTQLEDDAVQRLGETIAEPTEDDVARMTEASERMDAMWETLVETALQIVNTLDLMIDNYERVEGQEEMTARLEQFAAIWVETLATSRIVERPVIGEPFDGEWMASFGVDDRPVEEDVEPYTVTRAVRRAFFDEETSNVVQDAHVYTSAE